MKHSTDELSRQIKLHPKTAMYEIHYADNDSYICDMRFIYDRSKQTLVLSYEQRSNVGPPSRWVFKPRFPFIVKEIQWADWPLYPVKYELDVPDISHVTDQDIHNAAKQKLSWNNLFHAKKLRKP